MAGRLRSTYRASRDRLFVALTRGGRRLMRAVGVRRGLRLAGALARPLPLVLREPTRLAHEHLALALPGLSAEERARIVREMYRGLACSLVEVLLLEDLVRDPGRYVDADGLELMDEALAAGKGVVAITGHIGNWELLAAYFAARGYPVTVIATPVKGSGLNAENVALRARVGVETVLRDGPGASRDILRTLRRGRILAILMDQDTRGQAAFVPYFGRAARTPVGPAVLAQRTGARLVGVFIHRMPDGRHRITVRRPDLPEPPAGKAEAAAWIVDATARLTALIEEEVRRHPAEWVWWHRRWRRRADVDRASAAEELVVIS